MAKTIEFEHYDSYSRRVKDRGEKLLGQANVLYLLEELKKRIEPKHPDVQITGPTLTAGGTVRMNVQWDFMTTGQDRRNIAPDDVPFVTMRERYDCAFVGVEARLSLGEEIVVCGKGQCRLGEADFMDGKTLEQAIELTYGQDARMNGGPDIKHVFSDEPVRF